jgi:hypothetical protein
VDAAALEADAIAEEVDAIAEEVDAMVEGVGAIMDDVDEMVEEMGAKMAGVEPEVDEDEAGKTRRNGHHPHGPALNVEQQTLRIPQNAFDAKRNGKVLMQTSLDKIKSNLNHKMNFQKMKPSKIKKQKIKQMKRERKK